MTREPTTATATGDLAFEALLDHIKEQRGFDFTGYKRPSLERRVQRRLQVLGIESYDEYLDRLMMQPDEFTELFNTILINVTSFFRDLDAWDYLRQKVIPDLLQRRESQSIRIWCAGCASGQEAYSLAMLLAEALGMDGFRDRVKIYATDVDEDALAYARQASYTTRELETVPEELRDKYFEQVGSRHVFGKDLRRSVIFGRNDLVQDAPISHVDVLACRNTLMYFNAETQAQILARLHFALRPDGVLFLGKAEMLLSHAAQFRPVELKSRIFRKIATEPRDRRLVPMPNGENATTDKDDQDVVRLRQAALMSASAAQIVLDAQKRLVQSNHRAMHLFGLGPRDLGKPIQDLEVSYRPVELRSHIDRATGDRRSVWLRDVDWARGAGEPLTLDIQFVPLFDDTGGELGTTVLFQDVTQYRQLQRELQYANRQLETAYEELQSTNEELETTNEELQSTVEELETTNEELQSTNEELETMNEELQSMNDELQLSNEALRERQDEVERLNQFNAAVLGSMDAGVVVVDKEMKVLAWNTRSEDLWGVRSDEAIGEHLLNLDIGLPVDQLMPEIRRHVGEEVMGSRSVEVDAVNRRGRQVRLRTTLTLIRDHGGAGPALMLLMEEVPSGGETDGGPPPS